MASTAESHSGWRPEPSVGFFVAPVHPLHSRGMEVPMDSRAHGREEPFVAKALIQSVAP